jgi:hypothetical protein
LRNILLDGTGPEMANNNRIHVYELFRVIYFSDAPGPDAEIRLDQRRIRDLPGNVGNVGLVREIGLGQGKPRDRAIFMVWDLSRARRNTG